MKKFVPINGLKLNDELILEFDGHKVLLMPYEKFVSNFKNDIININEINVCDTIAAYNTKLHNTLEVVKIKEIISLFFFAYRLKETDKFEKDKEYKIGNEFLDTYILNGFWNDKREIKGLVWDVSLGNIKISKENFDAYLTRGFCKNLNLEYTMQYKFYPKNIILNVDELLIEKTNIILSKIKLDDEYSKKLKSVLRIYYDVLNGYSLENTIIIYSTILEVLLLDKDESNQRKKVSVRGSCIIFNEEKKEKKEFLADIIYYFYTYRNAIVHDGKAYFELDDNEGMINIILNYIKHIIYFIVKYIVENNIKNISEIKNIVKSNCNKDSLSNAFDYIKYDKFQMLYLVWDD